MSVLVLYCAGENAGTARGIAAGRATWYLSAMGGVYARAVPGQLAACGTCDQVRGQLRPRDRAAGIVTILLPPGMPWHSIQATLQAAAPSPPAGERPRDAPAKAAERALLTPG